MSKFFKKIETVCRCGCGLNNMAKSTMEKLDTARSIYGGPITLNRGCSCSVHNENVGGSKTSSHIATEYDKAHAVDIKVSTDGSRYRLICALLEAGFNRIGIAKNFIHIDDDPLKKINVMWTY